MKRSAVITVPARVTVFQLPEKHSFRYAGVRVMAPLRVTNEQPAK